MMLFGVPIEVYAMLFVAFLLLAVGDRIERAQNQADQDRRIDNWKRGRP